MENLEGQLRSLGLREPMRDAIHVQPPSQSTSTLKENGNNNINANNNSDAGFVLANMGVDEIKSWRKKNTLKTP